MKAVVKRNSIVSNAWNSSPAGRVAMKARSRKWKKRRADENRRVIADADPDALASARSRLEQAGRAFGEMCATGRDFSTELEMELHNAARGLYAAEKGTQS